MVRNNDLAFMQRAIALAGSVKGLASPDPAVAAVIVKNGKVIAEGYHDKFASPHAESFAIKKAGNKTKGATLYLNLEPCSHYGNNPPCAELIIKAGIKRVVASMKDPNPLVNGRGFATLKKAGIKVEVGLLREEAKKLNAPFLKYITQKMPYVTLKMAMTLDGKIATRTGDSFWISSKKSRIHAHMLRSQADAVLVGVGTVIKDDPKLTVRLVKRAKCPARIIVDDSARIPLSSFVLKDGSAKTIVFETKYAPLKKIAAIKRSGSEVLVVKAKNKLADFREIMRALAKKGISSVLIEGGGNIAAEALRSNIVDKIVFFVAPKIVGGKNAITPVEGQGLERIKDAIGIKDITCSPCGRDIMIEAYINPHTKIFGVRVKRGK